MTKEKEIDNPGARFVRKLVSVGSVLEVGRLAVETHDRAKSAARDFKAVRENAADLFNMLVEEDEDREARGASSFMEVFGVDVDGSPEDEDE